MRPIVSRGIVVERRRRSSCRREGTWQNRQNQAAPAPASVAAPAAAPVPASPLLHWAQAFTEIFTRVVVLALVFFVIVWPYLPFDAGTRWIVAGVVLFVIVAFSVAAFVMVRARSVAFFKSVRDA